MNIEKLEVADDKPLLLKAIEAILADPAEIQRASVHLHNKFQKRYAGCRSEEEITSMVADKIISNYSYMTAFVGGATALTGVVPGLGTVIATFGGSTADAALCMKYQIEMTMALASVYGHNIEIEEEKRLCLIIAGLGTISQAGMKGGKMMTEKAFVKITQQYLKGATLAVVKEIFKKVGVTFTRKALEKAIPFGVGVLFGVAGNKLLTRYVGRKAKGFFCVYSKTPLVNFV